MTTPRVPEVVRAFEDYFGIRRSQAQIVAGLWRHKDAALPIERLAGMGGVSISSAKVYLSEIREAMEAEAIDTYGGFYSLTEVGVGECRTAIDEYRRVAAA